VALTDPKITAPETITAAARDERDVSN